MADSADPIVDAAEVEVSSIFSIPSDPPPQPELETLQEENEDDFGDFGDFEDAEWETAEATPTEPSETSQVEVPAPAVHISANPSSGAPDLLRLDKGGFLKAATAALSSFAPAALKHPAQGQVFTLAHLEARHPQMQPRRKESGQDTQPSPGWSKSPAGTRLLHRLNLGPAPEDGSNFLSQTPARRSASGNSNASSSSAAAQQLPPIAMAPIARSTSAKLQPPPGTSRSPRQQPVGTSGENIIIASAAEVESTQEALGGLTPESNIGAEESSQEMEEYRNPFQTPRLATEVKSDPGVLMGTLEARVTSQDAEFDPFGAPPDFDPAAMNDSGIDLLIPSIVEAAPVVVETTTATAAAPPAMEWENPFEKTHPFETAAAEEEDDKNQQQKGNGIIEEADRNLNGNDEWSIGGPIEKYSMQHDDSQIEFDPGAAGDGTPKSASRDHEAHDNGGVATIERGNGRIETFGSSLEIDSPNLNLAGLVMDAERVPVALIGKFEVEKDSISLEQTIEEITNEVIAEVDTSPAVIIVESDDSSEIEEEIPAQNAQNDDDVAGVNAPVPDSKAVVPEIAPLGSEDFEWSEAVDDAERESTAELPLPSVKEDSDEDSLAVVEIEKIDEQPVVKEANKANYDDDFDEFCEAGLDEDEDKPISPEAVAKELAAGMPDLSFMLSDTLIEPKAKAK